MQPAPLRFGRVYGLGNNFFNLLAALLQYPLAKAGGCTAVESSLPIS
jgi:hypothetical protein